MKFEAILFDCDGVLVDSEPITNGVLRDLLEESGWSLSPAECMRVFVGKAVRDERVLIEAQTGQPLTEAWMAEFYARRNRELQARLVAIAGAHAAVEAAHAHAGQRIACASGADRFKVEMQLAQVGLMPWFDGRIFSGQEMPHSKPAPDVYLAAASHLGAAGAHCLVIEDTTTGVTAGIAAGATVWAYCPTPAHGPALTQAGASRLFAHMAELPALLETI
ncbi:MULTISPECIES: HAD family phosphatase [unclassified Polaromonas]|uniref:HAD family hydrolase n=1 Tax=unclassified Polaromonas TaxID=2638319 RepID=UPI0018C96138|nr:MULTISPECIES: HAD family phosphatase [unclassified Polaromonas]MBG6072935.1 HAD superfamily hydrolase (TIGR01509 family) [Polaromonas sp. CG_9.7]MBG6114915.1 HAD superfamily hydrolase (TIGR01509 family) [Polaromonas sp. CG_9.2]MDH6183637.1 HAD superfamily hydrolase (TIGR01509 family) [Polaromonas sp. CG_23.6]